MNNLKIIDELYQLKNWKHNSIIKKYIDDFQKIDSIQNYHEFKEKTIKLLNLNYSPLYLKKLGSESLHYGHLEALGDYCGIKNISSLGLYFEHGVNFSVTPPNLEQIKNSVCMFYQSTYKNKYIHNINPNKPVFCIGPIIQYVQGYYSNEYIEKIKKQYGKTVVVYTAHSYEESNIFRNANEFVESILNKIYDDFDTILICVYWNDINDSIYSIFSKYSKVKLVSAGMRFDPNFIKRTKTIIELADVVIGNDIGTYIGYAHFLQKPIRYIDTNDKINDSKMNDNEIKKMIRNKKKLSTAIKNKEYLKFNNLCEYYWGTSIKRSNIEIQAMFSLGERILKGSKYKKNCFDNIVIKMKNSMELSEIERQILFETTKGNNI